MFLASKHLDCFVFMTTRYVVSLVFCILFVSFAEISSRTQTETRFQNAPKTSQVLSVESPDTQVTKYQTQAGDGSGHMLLFAYSHRKVKQCKHNLTMWCLPLTIVATEKQQWVSYYYATITGQIFDTTSSAYVVLILPSYSIVLTDLKLIFLATMNVSFQYSICDILLPLSFLLSCQPNCFFAICFAQQ